MNGERIFIFIFIFISIFIFRFSFQSVNIWILLRHRIGLLGDLQR